MNGYEMLHKAWNSKGEMPFCVPRSSIIFQGHTVQNINDFDPNWALPDYRPVAAFKSLRFTLFFFRQVNIVANKEKPEGLSKTTVEKATLETQEALATEALDVLYGGSDSVESSDEEEEEEKDLDPFSIPIDQIKLPKMSGTQTVSKASKKASKAQQEAKLAAVRKELLGNKAVKTGTKNVRNVSKKVSKNVGKVVKQPKKSATKSAAKKSVQRKKK